MVAVEVLVATSSTTKMAGLVVISSSPGILARHLTFLRAQQPGCLTGDGLGPGAG